MRVSRSLKFLLLSLAVFSVVIPFLPYFVAPVHAEEPTLTTILSNLGFENITLTDVETFSAGTYNITLYAEFAGWHNINELSYYELNASDVFNVIFYGSDGGSGYVVPPVNKSFTADYEFGLSMLSQYNRRYFTQNSRNGDGKIHSAVYENLDDTGMYLIGFENTWEGGDQDYNDMVFSLELYTPPVNTPPSISGLPDLEFDEDTNLDNVIDLWNYASDAETPDENLIFTILSVTEPDVGVSIDSNRYIDVQPTANWYGTSEVTIQVSDGELTDTDSFNIIINPVNDPPVLAPLPDQNLDEDTTLPDAFDLDDYGSDIDVDPLTYSIIGNTNSEVGVSIDPENRIDIAPEANWYGFSIVTIQVSDGLLTDSENFTITVKAVNDSPVASDQSVTTDEDTPKGITLTAYDIDGDTLTYPVVTPPSHGILSGTAPNLIYTPDSDYSGPDSFTFKAYDGQAYSNIATVSITVNPENDPPVVSDIPDVAFPEDGSNSSIDLDDYVSDVDNADAEMTWTFTGNVSIIASIDANNVVTFTAPANWFGQETITFRATDPGGLWDEDATTVTVTSVNDPPVASNLAISPSNPVTTDDLIGSYDYNDLESDSNSGTEIRWYKDGILQLAYNDTLTIPSSATAKGEAWYFTVKPKDGMDFGDLQTSLAVVIGNSPPTAPVVDVTPNSPVTTDDLTCTVVTPSSDPDGETITYTYKWYKDGDLQSSLTTVTTELSVTIDSSNTTEGEVWKCVVTPNDGTEDGPTDQDEVTIGAIPNHPPSIEGVDITPDPAYTDDTLTATPYGWYDADGDPEGYTYQWYKNDAPISGETSNTLSSNNFVKDDQIKVICTPFDGEDYGTPKEDTITISNSAPSAPVVDVTPDFPLTTDDLVCTITTPSIDPDGDTVTYTYAWYKNNELQTDLTTDTVLASYTTKGDVWKCVVTPHGSDGPPDEDEVTIQNSPPVLGLIGNKTVDEETELSFTATAFDPDLETLIFSLSTGAPAGASITSGGYFTWTPTETQGPGVYNINITVSDGIDIDYEVITVTVNEINLPPVLNPIGAKTVSEGVLLQFTLTASDPDIPAQTLTYSTSNLPPGATFNPSTHVFSWTPTSGQAGVYSGVHFEVSDGYLTDSEDITITVTSGAPPPPPPAVGGSALPITLDLATSNSLIPQIGLASVLSVAVAATIILVRRRKKTLKREH